MGHCWARTIQVYGSDGAMCIYTYAHTHTHTHMPRYGTLLGKNDSDVWLLWCDVYIYMCVCVCYVCVCVCVCGVCVCVCVHLRFFFCSIIGAQKQRCL
jgi:hypothetical protein